MAQKIFNTAKGRLARYADLPLTNDGLIWVLLVAAGLETDAALQDRATLSDILAHNTEATFAGYARLTHATSSVVAVDNTNDLVTVDDTTDPAWSPTGAQALGKILCCYDPDTTTGTDADLVPLFMDDFSLTTVNGVGIVYQVASGGYFTAS